jgi:hypothetical protein
MVVVITTEDFMPPHPKIMVPGVLVGSGIASPTRRQSADHAAEVLLQTPAIHWDGSETTIESVTGREGRTEELRFAAKQVFLALVDAGLSYRDYCRYSLFKPHQIKDSLRAAMQYFHHQFERSDVLAKDLKLGNGEMLLVRMNHLVERQLESERMADHDPVLS